MTPVGRLILNTYSLVVVLAIMIASFKKIEKDEKGGWAAAALIPVLIFLINIV